MRDEFEKKLDNDNVVDNQSNSIEEETVLNKSSDNNFETTGSTSSTLSSLNHTSDINDKTNTTETLELEKIGTTENNISTQETADTSVNHVSSDSIKSSHDQKSSVSKYNEEIFEANRLREEEKLREKVRRKESKKRAKAIAKAEKRKTREIVSTYRGHRVAIVALFLAAIFLSGMAGASFTYFYLQSEVSQIRKELKLDSASENKESSRNDIKNSSSKQDVTPDNEAAKDTAEYDNAKAVTPDPERDDVKTSAEVELSTPAIAQAAIPAVVAIFTENTIRTPFGDAQVGGAGSGVIIDPKGYVVTNNHVVESGGEISVKLANGDKKDAEIVATDPANDIAVLKINGDDEYPYIEMADSDTVVIGEKTVAIGNPLGNLEGTVTSGIVSAMGREVSTKSEVTGQVVTIENAIQTDASINSGNSGGALLNAEGKLIGINSVKASTTSSGVSVDGIGFAIPSNHVKEIASRFINYDENGRPSFGIVATPLSEEQASPFGFPAGILVRKVTKDSGAEKAGLKVNDIITEVDGQKVSSINDMHAIKVKYSVGDKVKIKYFRAGEEYETDLILSKLTD